MINKTLRGRKWDTKEGGEGAGTARHKREKGNEDLIIIVFHIYLINTASKKKLKKKEQLSPVAYVDMYTHHFW